MQKKIIDERIVMIGEAGNLEGVLRHKPTQLNPKALAVLCHPHPLYGGTMNNKVVTTVAKAFATLEIPSLRFNYRGVEKSEGEFDNAVGEVADANTALNWLQNKYGIKIPVVIAGFSFGSYIVYQLIQKRNFAAFILLAPAVNHYEFLYVMPDIPGIIIQPEADEVVPAQLVAQWVNQLKAFKKNVEWISFPEASHFFHGQLNKLESVVSTFLKEKLKF